MASTNNQFISVYSALSGETDGTTASIADVATLVEKGLVYYIDDHGRIVSLSGNSPETETVKSKALELLSWLFRIAQSRMPPETDELAGTDEIAWALAIHSEELCGIDRFGWPANQLPDFDQLATNVQVSNNKMPGNKRVKSQNTLICALASMAGLSLKDASADYELIAKHLRLTSPSVVDLPQKRTISVVLDEAYSELN